MSATNGTRVRLQDSAWKICAALWLLLAIVLLTGCGGEAQARLEDYLGELEFDVALESVKDIPLGSFRLAGASTHQDQNSRDSETLWVLIQFDIHVTVDPAYEKAVLAAAERHRGMINDTVLNICRSTSVEELSEGRLSTLKSRLLDGLRPLLGEEIIRQVVLEPFRWEPL
jgi:hypothetical protein